MSKTGNTDGQNGFEDVYKCEFLGHINQRVMHTMNNLLSGVYGMAQLAQATGKSEHMEKAVEITVENCRKIKDLTRQLTEYSAGLSRGRGMVNLNAVMDTVHKLQEHDLEKYNVTVHRSWKDEEAFAAHFGEAQEILCRILQHAVDTAGNGGDLYISAAAAGSMLDIIFLKTGSVPVAEDLKAVDRLKSPGNVPIDDLPEKWRELALAGALARRNGGRLDIELTPEGRLGITVAFPAALE